MNEAELRKSIAYCFHSSKNILRIYALERQVRLLLLSIAAIAVTLLIHLLT